MLHPEANADMAGSVLCGGHSRRMGKDKALLAGPTGRTLLEAAVFTLMECAVPVAVAGPADRYAGYLTALALAQGWKAPPVLLADPVADAGPLAGVLAACEWARGLGRRAVLTVAVDTPLVPAAALDAVGRRCREGEWQMPVCVGGDGVDAPLVACWPIHLAEYIHTAVLSGQRGVLDLQRRLHTVRVTPSSLGLKAGVFRNLNTPEDLRAAGW